LQAAFGVNVLASILLFFPWGKQRIGFVTTHGALLVILVGACVSYFFKVEGRIMLWEGQSGNEIATRDPQGRVLQSTTLPFSVKLDDFRIDHYPGTMRPANFRSDVEITDPAGAPFKAAIWMNHELHHAGWSLFQSSYVQEQGREATILSVSKDPGQAIAFFGYIMLLVGMCIVVGTRATQRRTAEREAALRRGGVAAVLTLSAIAFGSSAWAADTVSPALLRLPVQHDGRVMPLETLAREAVWNVTGRRASSGTDAVATVLGWTADPPAAANAPIVKLGSPELAVAAGLPEGTAYVSFMQSVRAPAVMKLINQAHNAQGPRQGAVAAAEKLEERLMWLQGFLDQKTIRPIPAADVNAEWDAPSVPGAGGLTQVANGPRLQGWPTADAIEREIRYNAVRPTRVAWIILTIALILSIVASNKPSKALDGLALAGLVLGFGVMTWGIATRWAIADRVPASNMYESLLFLAWGVGLFAVIAFAVMRNRLVVLNANAMAALTMALTDLLPIDGFIHPVAPVLAGTVWLAIHVPIIMVGYSVLALGVVIAHMQLGLTIFAPQRLAGIMRMNDLLYWYIIVGSILLIAGILTGSMWAASSWGRYWGWDPKEVWSLVAFLAYIAILHARWDNIVGPFGVAAFSILAFQTILMTYLGVNFVLTTGMHSYGFGDSPIVTWMVVVAVVEAAFVLAALAAQRRFQASFAGAR
jgi:cytochrome c-type biogenesis protein CcsB